MWVVTPAKKPNFADGLNWKFAQVGLEQGFLEESPKVFFSGSSCEHFNLMLVVCFLLFLFEIK